MLVAHIYQKHITNILLSYLAKKRRESCQVYRELCRLRIVELTKEQSERKLTYFTV